MHQRFNGIFAFTLILAIALTGLGQQPAGSTRADNLKPGERRSDTPKKVVKVEDIEKDIAEALTVIINRIAEEAGLSDKDRAMLKRWRSSKMKLGTDDMFDYVHKANEDFARGVARRERSQIRKPDWAD